MRPPPIELMGDVLRIGHRSSRVSYEVVVPTNTRIQARTGSGALLIERVAGSVAATTGSGDVEMTAVGGNVDIRTGSGSIRVENFEAALRARTGRGEIQVEGTPGGVWNLATGSGGIRIDVPDEAAFEIDARTGSGAVLCDHPVFVREIRRGRLQGKVRGGGPTVALRTAAGSITIN